MYASICVDYSRFLLLLYLILLLWSHRLKKLDHLWLRNRTNELRNWLAALESDDRRKRPDLPDGQIEICMTHVKR